MKPLAELDYDELTARAAQAARLPALDDDSEHHTSLDVPADELRSGYGQTAVTSDPWLRARANVYLAGLPESPMPLDALRRLDEEALEAILVTALYEYELENRHLRAFNPAKHRRWPRGHPKAGKFRPMVGLLKEAIKQFDPDKDEHPFQHFTRPQLMKVAKERGISLKRGEGKDSIADKVLADLGGTPKKKAAEEKAPADKPERTAPGRPKTWEELGSPQGPPPVGQVIGYEGGTYERLPGEPRRYRVVNSEGRDISDQVVVPMGVDGRPGNQTADDARAALRVDAFNRQRVEDDAGSAWRETLGQVTGSWSYDTGQVEGFDDATPEQRRQIRDAIERWTTDKVTTGDETRMAEPRVNAAIRGATPRTEQVERDIEALDLAMTMSKTKRAITVYRGISNGSHILPDDWQDRDLAGLEWSVPGYTPTTGDEDTAAAYAGPAEHRGFAIRLQLPRGAAAIAVSDAVGGDDNEGEIVLPRNLTFRVTKDHGPQGPHGIRQLDVKIVRRRAPAASRRPRATATPVPAQKAAAPAKKAAQKAAAPTAARPSLPPGVTLDRIPQIFGDAPDAYSIKLNGERIGTVHGNEANAGSEWTPFRQTNAPWQLQNPGPKPSREAAVRELVDSYEAAQRPSTPAPAAAPAANATLTEEDIDDLNYSEFSALANKYGINLVDSRRRIIRKILEAMQAEKAGSRPAAPAPAPASVGPITPADRLIGALIPTSNTERQARADLIQQVVKEQLNGTYAGLKVQVTAVYAGGAALDIRADIYDANGNYVGNTQRELRNSHGTLWAYHAYLALDDAVQGQGFAEAWNSHLMKWYSESGLDRVEVTANIDVGGYTWARQGFDFKNQTAASDIATRLRRHIADYASRYDAKQISAAQAIVDRMTNLRFGDPNFPTAYEVSQVGRKPGQGKDDAWPGKNAMLGSLWRGVKPVPAAGTDPVS